MPAAGVLLIAHRGGEPLGCVALKLQGHDPAKIERKWIVGSGPRARARASAARGG